MSEPGKSGTWKLLGASALLVVTLVFVYAQYRKARPSLPERRPLRGEQGPPLAGRPGTPGGPGELAFNPEQITPEERRQFREEVYQQLNLTSEQRAKLDEINREFDEREGGGPPQFMERIRAQAEVLTPEQQDIARETMRERMRSRILERSKMLPPEEQKAFLERFEKRFEERRRQFEAERDRDQQPLN